MPHTFLFAGPEVAEEYSAAWGAAQRPKRRASPLLWRLKELRVEVRAKSREAHRIARGTALPGTRDYYRLLAQLFDTWIDEAEARSQVVCFAAATEFGLPMQHQLGRCKASATRAGCEAVRALYWAAVRRSHPGHGGHLPLSGASLSALSCRATQVESARAGTPPTPSQTCLSCERMRQNPRGAGTHPTLRAIGEIHAGSTVGSLMLEHECIRCETRWIRRWSASDPFTDWALAGRATIVHSAEVRRSTIGDRQ